MRFGSVGFLVLFALIQQVVSMPTNVIDDLLGLGGGGGGSGSSGDSSGGGGAQPDATRFGAKPWKA
ncbi:hypothetical protein FRB95_012642 [Tulasnella sp. JGI-2019a]|nr:hypothetical protein FRB95_012642 [Tulasnella sp. JGI-2019a]